MLAMRENRAVSQEESSDIPGLLGVALGHHRAGRLTEAERIYSQILALGAAPADCLHLLGMVAYQRGLYEAAGERIRQAIAVNSKEAAYHSNLGTVLQAQDKLHEAAACYEQALALQPDLAEVQVNLGNIFHALGRLDEAVACQERALALKPEFVEALCNLGNALQAQGKLDQAVACYRRALALRPECVEAFSNLGNALQAQNKMDQAVACYEHALALKPDYAEAHNNLGMVLQAQGKRDDAVAHYQRALALKPDYAYAHNNLGNALAAQERIDEAVVHYQRALVLMPDFAYAHNNMGTALAAQDRVDEAVAHFERALILNPDYADPYGNLGTIAKEQGKFEDALAYCGRAIAIRPDHAEAHFNRAEMKSFHYGDADLAALEALAERNDLPANKALYIHFALAKALQDCGDYARAFAHLRLGNALKRRQIDYQEKDALGLFQRVAATFDRSIFDRFAGEGDPSSVPVFVLGMPRSGSSLIEQILASHPQIHGGGELTALDAAARQLLPCGDGALPYPECVATLDGVTLRRLAQSYLARLPSLADRELRITDKLPGNFLSIGLIRLILPNARIVHTMRHPIDTCLSCYSKLFTFGQRFTYDLAELGRYYRCYRELMTHWRSVLPPGAMLDVSYKDVVDDLEGQARRLIDYCGLTWDDRCIAFHRTSRPVKTASAVQVRKPLFRSSLQRWRRYEAGLGPLLDELTEAIPGRAPVLPPGTTEAWGSQR
jgi:tetratricopeptide (TPR) repeat protein